MQHVRAYDQIVEVQMNGKRRLPQSDSLTGARGEQVADYYRRHGFPARVLREEEQIVLQQTRMDAGDIESPMRQDAPGTDVTKG